MSKTILPRLAKPTKRQYEVLTLFLQCNTYKQIANELSISHRTVADHLENLRFKLHLLSNLELKELAISQKWIEYEIKPYDKIKPIKITI